MMTRLRVALALTVVCGIGCSTAIKRPRPYHITGEILERSDQFAVTDLGAFNHARRGAKLVVLRVGEEETHASTFELERVRLDPVGVLEIAETNQVRSIGKIIEGGDVVQPGLYVRLAPPDGAPTESWWESASDWWFSFHHKKEPKTDTTGFPHFNEKPYPPYSR